MIHFHVHHLIFHFNVHGRRPLYEKKSACVWVIPNLCHPQNYIHKKIFLWWRCQFLTFTQVFYIPAIIKLVFFLSYVRIIGTHHCGNTLCKAFKCYRSFKDLLFYSDYDNRMVDKFAHQIQSE